MGQAYSYDGWTFVVVRDRDEFSIDALALDDYGWRHKAGELVEVRHNSAVGQGALRIA